MRRNLTTYAALLMAVLLVSACGSSGGLGDILGTNNPSSNTIRGTVDYVDANNQTIYLTNVSGYSSMLSNSGSNNTVRVRFDSQTPVDYNGQSYRPTDLERGDEVDIRVTESGNELQAESVSVVRDVSSGTSSSGSYLSTVRGTVRSVDTSRRTVTIDQGSYANPITVEYDSRTNVVYSGRSYTPADLERGDEVEVRVNNLGGGRYLASDVTVVRSISSGTSGSSSSAYGTVRGTVRYVDTVNRTIELEQTSGVTGFNPGGGTMIVQYGSNVGVEVSGRSYPITSLERGDVIDVQVDRSGSSYFANRILLVREVNAR